MKFYRPVAVASYRKLVGYQAGLLAGTCAMVAALILIGNTVTSERIEAMENADQLKMLSEVLPPDLYDNDLLADQLRFSVTNNTSTEAAAPEASPATGKVDKQLTVYLAKSNSKISGMAFPVTANGYGGDIDIIVGIDGNGAILGVRVISHKETPGLGDKIEISRDQWITGFNGLSLANTSTEAWAVKKDGGQFDQFTGATITPRSIVTAVHQGLMLINEQKPAIARAVKKQAQAKQSLAMVADTKAVAGDNKSLAAEIEKSKANLPETQHQTHSNESSNQSTTEVATSDE